MYYGLNILRGVAALFIVGNHIPLSPRTEWGGYVIMFCNMFVAVFGSISGFLLAKSIEKSGDQPFRVVKGRFYRLFTPFVFWSLFYVVISVCFAVWEHSKDKIERLVDAGYWLSVIFCGGAATHLWYLASLVYCILGVAILVRIVPQAMKSIAFLFPFSFLTVALSAVIKGHHWATYDMRLFGFVLLGYAVYCIRRRIAASVCVWGFVSAVMIAGYMLGREFVPRFILDWLVTCPMMLAATDMKIRPVGFLEILNKCSMGVFLLHPMFTMIFSVILQRISPSPYGVLDVVGVWVLAIVFSGLSTAIILKSRLLSRFVS